MTILTPYLPKEAQQSIREHYAGKKMPAFVKAVELGEDYQGYCQNCAGLGVIIVQFCDKGPFWEVPTTTKAITYFEGDGTTKRGWYIVGRTVEFTCPHCNGARRLEPAKDIAASEKSKADWPERRLHKPAKIGGLVR